MSRILTTVAAFAATTLMSSAAFAGCNNGTYCNSNAHSSVSMYETSPSYSTSGYTTSSNHSTSPMYNTAYSYGVNNSYGGVMSSSAADATYGTGSISNAYTGGDVELYNFSGSTGSVAGLGMNESLQPTTCPVSVHNPSGARVLGCYNVVKPVPQTTYYRVVRPVIYVRYPVPVAVPYYSGCTVVTHQSRYGERWGHQGNYGRRCG